MQRLVRYSSTESVSGTQPPSPCDSVSLLSLSDGLKTLAASPYVFKAQFEGQADRCAVSEPETALSCIRMHTS